jgi:hypothetical protein
MLAGYREDDFQQWSSSLKLRFFLVENIFDWFISEWKKNRQITG